MTRHCFRPPLRAATPIAVALLTGCVVAGRPATGGAPPAAPAATVELAYRPTAGSATYVQTDSVTMRVQGDFGTLRIEGGFRALTDLTFEEEGGGVLVRARLVDFAGEMRNPSAGITRADESDVRGEWVLRLDPRGRIETVRRPEVSRRFLTVVGSPDLLRNLFRRLPGEAVARGEVWTDTIRITEEGPAGLSESTAEVASTWVGDTIVGGRRLHVIDSRIESRFRLEGRSDGVAVEQRLAGTTTARTLWDPLRGLVVLSEEEGMLEGTLDVPENGMTGLPLRAHVRRRFELDQGW